MIRSILVPLDGSRLAEAAIPAARRLAVSARARLHLMLVHQPTAAGRQAMERYLDETVPRIVRWGDPATDASLQDGAAAENVVDGIREAAAELVVMATPGPASIAPSALTVMAGALTRTCPVPLLLVQPQGAESDPPVGVRALLAPVSPERNPELVIGALADFACLTQAHVNLLNVVAQTAMRGAAQQRLDRLADALRDRGISAAARVVVGPDIPAVILKEFARGPTNTLALAPRRPGASGWNQEDGITESLLRNATMPVLILPLAAGVPRSAIGA
jgi:nucleotide-binding universal stress UspA family protein